MRGAHEFTREDIEDLLAALGARLQARGVAATVYVVGGAAIVLRDLSSDRRTADVDASMVPEEDSSLNRNLPGPPPAPVPPG